MEQRIIRSLPTTFETREAEDGKLYIEGYFSVFDSNYDIFDGASESVRKGAFAESLKNNDIRCLIDHETRLVLGRNKAGTLELREDEKGLWGKVEVNPKDQDAMNLYARVIRGDVNQCSFGFMIRAEETDYLPNGDVHWTLTDVDLFEVSIVTFPAYEDTAVSARKHDYDELKKRELDAWKAEMKKKLGGN